MRNKDKFVIPEVYLDTVDKCMEYLQKVDYDSYGFPMFFLSYAYFTKTWQAGFRNPSNFKNPEIQAK